MLITRFVIRSCTILERSVLNTDALDPTYLEFVCDTLVRARASLSPLTIIEDPESPTVLGLGWPEGISPLRATPDAQQAIGQFFGQMAEPNGTIFYIKRDGSGPVYAVLSTDEEQDEHNDDEWDAAREAEIEELEELESDLLAQLEADQPGELTEKLARFDSMWEEAMDSLPVVLQFGPSDWGQNWDDYAMYVATAILLED